MKKLILKLYLFIRKNCLHAEMRSIEQIAIDDGMKVGKNFHCKADCILDPGHVFLITIGDNVTLAPRVHLLAHDASTKELIGYTRIAPVHIGNNVFIGANSTVLPGVTIGDNVVVGANSLVSHDIPSGSVCVGNPARVIETMDEYVDKQKQFFVQKPNYGSDYIITNITEDKKDQMRKELDENKFGYIV